MNIIAVIPARYNSSRFPGKPLALIDDKPMIWWVYQQVKKARGLDDVIVATDNEKIVSVCDELRMNCILTATNHPTGVDRLSEVAYKIYADNYLLIQGDEPLIETENIEKMTKKVIEENDNTCVRTFKSIITSPVDVVNMTIIKIVTDSKQNVLFASRSPIPYPKGGIEFQYYKSVGIYSYPRDILIQYAQLPVGELELAEDHDFMRLLENGIRIKAYTTDSQTISVDTPKDLLRVRREMKKLWI